MSSVDGTHVKWVSFPNEQFYEYLCYKTYPSIVILAVVTADHRFRYADVERPGVLGESIIFYRSSLKANIGNGTWLGTDIPDLQIADISVRPYLIEGCAFTQYMNMMKTTSIREQAVNVLKYWNNLAGQTTKPVECAFGVLKHRFLTLKEGCSAPT